MTLSKLLRNPLLAGFFMAVTLLGCGGGGDQEPSAVSVELRGDSIFSAPGIERSPASYMKAAHPGWVVDDRSVSGLALFQALPFAFGQSSIVVIEMGGNDALYPRTAEMFEADLRAAIGSVISAGKRPVLTGIVNMPVSPDFFTAEALAKRDAFNAITLRVAAELGLSHAGWGEDYRGEIDVIFDRIHRTQEASDRLAALLVQAIERGAE